MDLSKRAFIFALSQHSIRWLGTQRARSADNRGWRDSVERLGKRIGVSAYGRVGGDASARFGVVHPHHFNKRKKRELRIKGCRAPSAKGSFQTCNAGRAA